MAEQLLVTPEWLVAHHADARVRVLDPRRPEEYGNAHVPGAASVWTGFKDESDKLHVLPTHRAEAEIRDLGVSNDTTAVVMGDGMLAGRVWWVLRFHGLRDVRIADGGHAAYLAAGGPESADRPATAPGTFSARRDPKVICGAEDIVRELGTSLKVLDVRSDDEWQGQNTYGHKRVGHIPGAVHLVWDELLTADRRFRSPEELRAIVAAHGLSPRDRVITVCEVGYRAAHSAFALRLAGFDDVRVYDASMREWDDREDLPLEPPDVR